MLPEWLDVVQLIWLVGSCYACFMWGKNKGIEETITVLLEENIVTEKQLKKLGDIEE